MIWHPLILSMAFCSFELWAGILHAAFELWAGILQTAFTNSSTVILIIGSLSLRVIMTIEGNLLKFQTLES